MFHAPFDTHGVDDILICSGTCLDNISYLSIIQILTILKEKSVDDEILEPYLEAGASWRIDELMEIIRDGEGWCELAAPG